MRAMFWPGQELYPIPNFKPESSVICSHRMTGVGFRESLGVLTGIQYLSSFEASATSHRSGLNSSASCPHISLLRWNTQGLTDSVVPCGKNSPPISTPPAGAMRGKHTGEHDQYRIPYPVRTDDDYLEDHEVDLGYSLGTGLLMRRPSLMQACRYGSCWASEKDTTFPWHKPARTAAVISARALAHVSG